MDMATQSILKGFARHSSTIDAALQDALEEGVSQDFDGENAVIGIWRASDLIDLPDPSPLAFASFGPDKARQFEGGECLAMNILNKARACAQIGMDTLLAEEDEPWHFLVVRGLYFPWGGAILRRIGRIEFVMSTSGFTSRQDHTTSMRGWHGTCDILCGDIKVDLRNADLKKDDPEYRKYPLGPVGKIQLDNLGLFPGQVS